MTSGANPTKQKGHQEPILHTTFEFATTYNASIEVG
jgi:hypothetical protein